MLPQQLINSMLLYFDSCASQRKGDKIIENYTNAKFHLLASGLILLMENQSKCGRFLANEYQLDVLLYEYIFIQNHINI